MAAAIRQFFPRAELLRQDRSAVVGGLLDRVVEQFEGDAVERVIVAEAVAKARRDILRNTATADFRSMVMLTPERNLFVVSELRRASKWPKVASELWALLIVFAPNDDGEVLIKREGLISRLKASKRAVDGVLRELVEMRALSCVREPEPGKQGRGTARYFINHGVATRLKRGERVDAQRKALSLVPLGGASPGPERRARACVVGSELL